MTTNRQYHAGATALQSIARAVGRCRERNSSLKALAKKGEFDMKALDDIDEIVLRLTCDLESKAMRATKP